MTGPASRLYQLLNIINISPGKYLVPSPFIPQTNGSLRAGAPPSPAEHLAQARCPGRVCPMNEWRSKRMRSWRVALESGAPPPPLLRTDSGVFVEVVMETLLFALVLLLCWSPPLQDTPSTCHLCSSVATLPSYKLGFSLRTAEPGKTKIHPFHELMSR